MQQVDEGPQAGPQQQPQSHHPRPPRNTKARRKIVGPEGKVIGKGEEGETGGGEGKGREIESGEEAGSERAVLAITSGHLTISGQLSQLSVQCRMWTRPVHKMLRFLPIMLCSDSFKMPLLCPATLPIMLALCPLCRFVFACAFQAAGFKRQLLATSIAKKPSVRDGKRFSRKLF